MTEEVVLHAELREIGKKSVVKGLRRAGKIPAVIYGGGKKEIHISVSMSEFLHIHHKVHLLSHVLTVDVGGKKEKVLVKEVQFNPVKDVVSHIDFVRISPKREIEVEVPLEFVGTSPGEEKGGILDHVHRTIKVRTIPSKLPEKIEVDISSLDMGDVITAGDLKIPEGVKLVTEKETIIVTVLTPKEEPVEEVSEEGEEEPEVIKKGKAEEEAEETKKQEKAEKKEE